VCDVSSRDYRDEIERRLRKGLLEEFTCEIESRRISSHRISVADDVSYGTVTTVTVRLH